MLRRRFLPPAPPAFTRGIITSSSSSSPAASCCKPLPCVGGFRFSTTLQRHRKNGVVSSSCVMMAAARECSSRTSTSEAEQQAQQQTTSKKEEEQEPEHESRASSDITPEAIAVSRWLFICSGVVFAIVVVGGITRLTESGLSIVEWRPVAGMIPPLSRKEWEDEFAKYQKYPEYSQNPHMDLAHFKFIFFWEWAHRVLARSVGVIFTVPLIYFAARGYFRRYPKIIFPLTGLLLLGGAQGALGWWMVKSGLDPKLVEENRKATVSAYRLAAHLSLALVLFASMLRLGLAIRFPRSRVLPEITFRTFWDVRMLARVAFASLGLTIVSGAFVAGLDAGLYFNDEFPWMDGGILPRAEYVNVLQPFWRNFTENPIAVQMLHRLMAFNTSWTVFGLVFMMRYKRMRLGSGEMIPQHVERAVTGVAHLVILQVMLGMLTIMWSVPVPVAALHQANSVLTLAGLLRLMTALSSRGTIRL